MKIVRDSFGGGDTLEKNNGQDAFFEAMPPEMFEAVCRGIDASLCPMAWVSEKLMVLRQTISCRNILEDGCFYSIESALRQEQCDVIRESIRTKTEHTSQVTLMGQSLQMRVIPADQGALLVFQRKEQHQAGVTLAVGRMRESAGRLMNLAALLEGEESGLLRREALRVLRQLNHVEMMSGVPSLKHMELYSVKQLLEEARRQLDRLGVQPTVRLPEKDIALWADKNMLLSAIMTLVSNSLRYGGSDVNITLSAQGDDSGVMFCVSDNGIGLGEQALHNMNDAWRRPDAQIGGWGLGVPYARRIAELHNGVLVFAQSEQNGCEAHIHIPVEHPEESGLESACGYDIDAAAAANPAEIELSDALKAAAFGTQR